MSTNDAMMGGSFGRSNFSFSRFNPSAPLEVVNEKQETSLTRDVPMEAEASPKPKGSMF